MSAINLRDALAASVKAAAAKALNQPHTTLATRPPSTRPSERFTKLGDPLLARGDLSANTKLLLALLTRRAAKNGHCWLYQRTLVRDLGLSRRTVQRHLAKLLALGLIVPHTAPDPYGEQRVGYLIPALSTEQNSQQITDKNELK